MGSYWLVSGLYRSRESEIRPALFKTDINNAIGQVRSHFESHLGFAFACRYLVRLQD